ncbi:Putative mutator protein MutT4 [Roseimaritima multifibrata]|uniref:Bis(5'-nucleosyl)-tetraphosphatase [asymmetrical] n=1 Tax=Roseimaritima multifibrata TaxID=1930274 RepID=A0A517MLX1_9BACT|nr:NUDIX domain-containing protein [Roseimaritima multifibrata]QDS95881.1 Putative mutator protein MutT4 [Roseimaritima multifibrata]
MSNRTVVYAAGVLLLTRDEPRKFLLMRHSDRWDLPKGHAEKGEHAYQTALREMEEETGISASEVQLDPGFRYRSTYEVTYRKQPGEVFEKRVTFFLGWIDRPVDIICTEHPESGWIQWHPPHQIQAQAIDPLLQAVAEYLEGSKTEG